MAAGTSREDIELNTPPFEFVVTGPPSDNEDDVATALPELTR